MSEKKKKFDVSSHIGLISSLIAILSGLLIALIVLMVSKPSAGFNAFLTLLTGGNFVEANIIFIIKSSQNHSCNNQI